MKIYGVVVRGLLAIVGVLLVLSTAAVYGDPPEEIGTITAPRLNMRPEPGTQTAPIKILRKGATVKILKRFDGWIEIMHEGQVGYIRDRTSYVHIIKDPDSPPARDNAIPPDTVPGTPLDENDIQRFKKEAEDIGRKIEKSRSEVMAITKEETRTINSLDEIDLTLNKTRRRVQSFESELVDLEKKIEETTRLSEDLLIQIQATEDYAAKRLAALYRLNWLGTLNFIASAESIYEIILRKKALERVLAYDENMRRNFIENKARLEALLEKQNSQKKEKLSLDVALNEQIKIMTREKSKRSMLLADIRNQRALELAAIESFKQAAITLDQTIKSLNVKLDQPEYVEKKAEDTQQKPFHALKGLLKMPVKGKIVSFFGSYKNTKFNVVNFRSGIDIDADRGEPVHAVSTGKTIYSSWFKGYGNMIIIDHGDSYYTVYAHIEELFKDKGDPVEVGEVIATVGDSGSMHGPRLYFEIRHRGKPEDPLVWIKEG